LILVPTILATFISGGFLPFAVYYTLKFIHAKRHRKAAGDFF
jgi:hypothetical protein